MPAQQQTQKHSKVYVYLHTIGDSNNNMPGNSCVEHFEHTSYHTSRGGILTMDNVVLTIQQGVQPYGSFQLEDAPGTRYEAGSFVDDGSSTGYPYNVNEGCNMDSASKETASPLKVLKHK
ncbi:hypothetical protein PAXRUDRAFT_135661 [Paxillus rubicundulus Ve08.2h10]|uniref:Unplaced genomic scaffold scaffold_100, whole genome shotgun sequence n=1 Tax=Paxillus rubicundulus Ve08.2h10 TaxID=930991 RepID=A0A0D0EBJ5_9AGAM|nr:hypothetical protein PAXRUDRAFT_135661 [Paxillus rubicundulus Ve08.2h10]